jgi:SAM-dependent methyltransferase
VNAHGPKTEASRISRTSIAFGDLRRTHPVSSRFGFDRGLPVDRFYIEGFLARHAATICGRVLEFGDDSYTRRFGGSAVIQRDVLDVSSDNGQATLIGDLSDAPHLPSGVFDCIICTQTLHLIFELHAAVATLHRLLRPGGVLLATAPGIGQIGSDRWATTWCWGFTPLSATRLLSQRFPEANIEVTSMGNVLAAVAFLHGLAADELDASELAVQDPAYPLVVLMRATKPSS